MGKWISRCIEKNTETNAIPDTSSIGIAEKRFEPASMNSSNISPALDHLTETEREAYLEWFEVMTTGKAQLSPKEAHTEAMSLLVKTSRLLKIDQATQDYKLDGYLKIFSTKLNRHIYLVMDRQVKATVPDRSLQVFLESEIEALKGLNHDELMLVLEARAIFNFNGVIEDGDLKVDL